MRDRCHPVGCIYLGVCLNKFDHLIANPSLLTLLSSVLIPQSFPGTLQSSLLTFLRF
jgi:hypothetical protein